MNTTEAIENKYYWGIDPGSLVMGYAILNDQGALVTMGTLTLTGTDAEKYKAIFHFMNQISMLNFLLIVEYNKFCYN